MSLHEGSAGGNAQLSCGSIPSTLGHLEVDADDRVYRTAI